MIELLWQDLIRGRRYEQQESFGASPQKSLTSCNSPASECLQEKSSNMRKRWNWWRDHNMREISRWKSVRRATDPGILRDMPIVKSPVTQIYSNSGRCCHWLDRTEMWCNDSKIRHISAFLNHVVCSPSTFAILSAHGQVVRKWTRSWTVRVTLKNTTSTFVSTIWRSFGN